MYFVMNDSTILLLTDDQQVQRGPSPIRAQLK